MTVVSEATGIAGRIDTEEVSRALRRHAPADLVHAGVFIEDSVRVGVRYADSRVADLTHNQDRGSCVRWITESGVRYRAGDTANIMRLVDGSPVHRGTPAPAPEADAAEEPVIADLVRLAAEIDTAARDHDGRVAGVIIDAEHHRQRIAAITPDGAVGDDRHLRYLTIRVVAREGGRMASSYYTPGTSDPDGRLDPGEIGAEAAARALTSLAGRPAPIRHMPVVVGPGRGMVLIHEACCHPLEGDEVLRGSVYGERLGELIADPCLSIDDDPLIPGAVGSYRVDDEGVTASRTPLVESGRLTGYLTDEFSAARLGRASSGNCRREGYGWMPLPRMSNTCVRAGDRTPESIIAETEFGLYAEHVGGGEVIESTGDFAFRVMNGYLIENGKLTDPVQETTVSGNGAAVLLGIDAVGNDVRVGSAKCGKYGQYLPVGVVGPTLRIRSLLVGGTQR